jgi:hypothetical protein
MKFTSLFLAVSVTFVGCANATDDSPTTGGEAVTAAAARPPAFLQAGSDGSATIDGKTGDKLKVSNEVDALAKRMSDIAGNVPGYFAGAAIKLAPADVSALTRETKLPKAFGYDLMSLAGGYVPAGPERIMEELVNCSRADASKFQLIASKWDAYTNARSDDQVSQADRDELKAKLATFVGSFRGDGEPITMQPTQSAYFKCTWSNDDDTQANALVAMEGLTGVVRVIVGVDGP